jgi:hypothetical protein
MKNFRYFIAVVLAAGSALQAVPQERRAAFSAVEISFLYTRQSGMASNQYAVWVEDGSGAVVRTLYATRYTAAGGWKVREQSIPQWVKKANVASMRAGDIDAVSSATPRTGKVAYKWDGTDKNGKRVPDGEYRVFLEASLRWGVRVVYTATVSGSAREDPQVEVRYYDGNTELTGAGVPAERGMISGVAVSVR